MAENISNQKIPELTAQELDMERFYSLDELEKMTIPELSDVLAETISSTLNKYTKKIDLSPDMLTNKTAIIRTGLKEHIKGLDYLNKEVEKILKVLAVKKGISLIKLISKKENELTEEEKSLNVRIAYFKWMETYLNALKDALKKSEAQKN